MKTNIAIERQCTDCIVIFCKFCKIVVGFISLQIKFCRSTSCSLTFAPQKILIVHRSEYINNFLRTQKQPLARIYKLHFSQTAIFPSHSHCSQYLKYYFFARTPCPEKLEVASFFLNWITLCYYHHFIYSTVQKLNPNSHINSSSSCAYTCYSFAWYYYIYICHLRKRRMPNQLAGSDYLYTLPWYVPIPQKFNIHSCSDESTSILINFCFSFFFVTLESFLYTLWIYPPLWSMILNIFAPSSFLLQN